MTPEEILTKLRLISYKPTREQAQKWFHSICEGRWEEAGRVVVHVEFPTRAPFDFWTLRAVTPVKLLYANLLRRHTAKPVEGLVPLLRALENQFQLHYQLPHFSTYKVKEVEFIKEP